MDLNLKKYTAKELEGLPKLLNLNLLGEKRYYFLSNEIYIDEENDRCFIEYVGGIKEEGLLQ